MTRDAALGGGSVSVHSAVLSRHNRGWLGSLRRKERDPAPGSLSLRMLWSEGLSAARLRPRLQRVAAAGPTGDRPGVVVAGCGRVLTGRFTRWLAVIECCRSAPGIRLFHACALLEPRGGRWIYFGREALLMVGVSSLAAPVLFWLTPWIIESGCGSAMDDGYMLTAAVIVVGFVRLWQGLAAAVVNAIGTPRELFIIERARLDGIALAVALRASPVATGWLRRIRSGCGMGVIAVGATTLAVHRDRSMCSTTTAARRPR